MFLLFGLLKALFHDLGEVMNPHPASEPRWYRSGKKAQTDWTPGELKRALDPSWNGFSEEEWERIASGEELADDNTTLHVFPPTQDRFEGNIVVAHDNVTSSEAEPDGITPVKAEPETDAVDQDDTEGDDMHGDASSDEGYEV